MRGTPGVHAGKRFDDLGAFVEAEGIADLPVGVLDPLALVTTLLVQLAGVALTGVLSLRLPRTIA
ncbi:hypothetical protein [Streptomyces canus]|uniref:hypothetical protein n=1 Tax=Streptomyces canus TaxID=58343 RepID=UPI003868757A|nr:hypothetical protein OH824_15660 [Streptomyces canus]